MKQMLNNSKRKGRAANTCCVDNNYKKTIDINQAVEYAAYTDENAAKALENALDIRKFEIELYWKRASYFWTFIGLIYVAYCGVLVKMDAIKSGFRFCDFQISILFIISCIGLCLSLAWFYVNKGSKFWQENWENIISLLENRSIGNSYKLILERADARGLKAMSRILFEPESYSVSKINQLLSLFNVIIWLWLNAWSIFMMYEKSHFPLVFYISFFFSCLFYALLVFKCSSHLKSHEVMMTVRDDDEYIIADIQSSVMKSDKEQD